MSDTVGLEIHLKGGASFVVDVTDFTYKRGPSGKSMEWTTAPDKKGRRRLVTVDLEEIAALVEITR